MKKYVHYLGKKLYYSDEGSGPPLMLVHGYLETADVWNGFKSLLGEDFRIIAVDLPGHGLSDMYSDTHSMEFMAEALNGILNAIGIDKVFLTGHSMGGYVTLAFVEQFREKLQGYCLFHSHPFPDTPQVIEKREGEIRMVNSGHKYLFYPDNIKRMFAPGNLKEFSPELDRMKNIAAGIRGEAITAVLKGMMLRSSRQRLLESGQVPLLWILGRHDNYIQFEKMVTQVRLPVNGKIAVLEKSGHLGFIEEREESARLLKDFIRAAFSNS